MRIKRFSQLVLAQFLCASAVLFASSLHGAGEARSISKLIARCSGVYNLCSYYDRETGEQAFEGEFERAFGFAEGRASVRIGGLFGFIDQSGDIVVEPAFDFAVRYKHGLAVVKVDGRVGVIDREGDLVVDPQFAAASVLSPDVLLVQEPLRTVDGGFVAPRPNDHSIGLSLSKRTGLFHISDGWIAKPRYYVSTFDRDGGELIWANENPRREGPYGLLRADGRWRIEPSYGHVQMLSEGLAIVCTSLGGSDSARRWGKCGAVDRSGKLAVPTIYDGLSYWRDGIAPVQKDGQSGFLDKQGRLVGGRFFEDVERPLEGELPRVRIDGVWHGVLPNNELTEVSQKDSWERVKEILRDRPPRPRPPRPKLGNLDCYGGGKIYGDNGKWGIKDPEGEVIIEAKHSAIDCFWEGVAWVPVEAKEKWCPVGPDGVIREKPNCIEQYSPIHVSHHGPERLHENKFQSSVLWMQAFLAYGADPTLDPPKLVGDGVRGHRETPVTCRSGKNCF